MEGGADRDADFPVSDGVCSGVKALFFDVFGTLVDYPVWRPRRAHSGRGGIVLDRTGFADAWRDQYQPAMQAVRSGSLPYTKLDVLHRRFTQREIRRNLLAHSVGEIELTDQLDAWPDGAVGSFTGCEADGPAPVSNGNTALQCDLPGAMTCIGMRSWGGLCQSFQAGECYLAAADASICSRVSA